MPFMSRKLWFIFLRLLFKRINGEIAKCNGRISISLQLYTMNCTKLSLNWNVTFYCLPVVIWRVKSYTKEQIFFVKSQIVILDSVCLNKFFSKVLNELKCQNIGEGHISQNLQASIFVKKKGGTFFNILRRLTFGGFNFCN